MLNLENRRPFAADRVISSKTLLSREHRHPFESRTKLTETLLSFEHRHHSASAMKTLLNFENRHHFTATYRKDWKEQTQATCGGSYDGRHKLS